MLDGELHMMRARRDHMAQAGAGADLLLQKDANLKDLAARREDAEAELAQVQTAVATAHEEIATEIAQLQRALTAAEATAVRQEEVMVAITTKLKNDLGPLVAAMATVEREEIDAHAALEEESDTLVQQVVEAHCQI